MKLLTLLLAEIAVVFRIGKMKGKFEESKGLNLPNQLYIVGIYSTKSTLFYSMLFYYYSSNLLY